jgi:hypothetical protein
VLREIRKAEATASLCEARLVDGLTDEEVRGLFVQARAGGYRALASDVRTFARQAFRLAPAPFDEARAAQQAVSRASAAPREIARSTSSARQARAAKRAIAGLEERIARSASGEG